jgi:hypothetical protein
MRGFITALTNFGLSPSPPAEKWVGERRRTLEREASPSPLSLEGGEGVV